MMKYEFRKAIQDNLGQIWDILQQAILRRRAEGSLQWQDGYPNPDVVRKDIDTGAGHVLADQDTIAGYCAVLINDEPAYVDISGEWISNGEFLVVHRVVVAPQYLGRGLARELFRHVEVIAISKGIVSIRADTNFDNLAMISIFDKLGYIYCGEVFFRSNPRKAFEKVLQ